MRRVVITGCGALTPRGDDVESAWGSVLSKQSWIGNITKFDPSQMKSHVCGEVKITDELVEKYSKLISVKERRRMDDVEYVSVITAFNALSDAGLIDKTKLQTEGENVFDLQNNGCPYDTNRFGTFIGSGIGGLKVLQEGIITLREKGPRRVSPFFLPAALTNMSAGNVALKFGLKGATMTHVSACASSTHSVGEAFEYIRSGKLDACVAGGTEMAVCEIGITGFDAMNALSTKYNEMPAKASRALDKDRDGFVMSEGSVILVLEELEHAKARGAKIYCEIAGYGASCDAHHITAPDAEGRGASRAMEIAIADANMTAADIDYINLHGTSTPMGDICEIKAIRNTFGAHANKVAISSTKSITGHLLGATGALEAMFCALAIKNQIVPPSANIENLADECAGMNIVQEAKQQEINTTLSNSFGFGGTNGCLVLKKYVD